MHKIKFVEVARQKAKAIENKLEGAFQSRFGKVYSRRNIPQTIDTDTYLPPHLQDDKRKGLEAQRIKEGKCKRCGEKWDPKHICHIEDNSKKLYTCEAKNDDESNSEEEEIKNPQNIAPNFKIDDTPRISRAAMTGISQPQTLKLKGHQK